MPTTSTFPGQNDTLANLPDRKDNRDYNLADDINESRHFMIATEPMLGDQIQGGGANAHMPMQNGATPGMTVLVVPGTAWYGQNELNKRPGSFVSPTFTAPITNPRIDVLSLDSGGTYHITQGTEAVTPTVPALPFGQFKCGEIYLRPGCTQIYSYANQIGGQAYIRPDSRSKYLAPQAAGGGGGTDPSPGSLSANGTATGTTASNSFAAALTSTGTGPRQLYAVRVHFSGATSGNITVTLSSAAGAAYNALLNPSVTNNLNADTDFVWTPDVPVYLGTGDQVTVNATGLTNGLTYGVQVDMSTPLGGNLVVVTNTGSAGEINFTSALTGAFRLAAVSVHLSAGVTGTFKINRVAAAGAAYNELLGTATLSADTDINQSLDAASVMNAGDQTQFVSTGVTGKTWGLRACYLQ